MITGNQKPDAAGTITGTGTVCQGHTGVSYSVPAISNATGYNWVLPTGATIVAGNNTNSILVDYSSSAISGTIKVQGTNNCGVGVVSPVFSVTVNSLPAQPTAIEGSLAPCLGSFQTYSVTNVNGVTYSWVLPVGWTINAGQGSNSINTTVGHTGGDIEVTPVNACGSGIPRLLSVGITVADSITWTGNVSSVWDDPGNWNECGIPYIPTHVIIPDVSPRPFPIITGDYYCKTLKIKTGAFMTVTISGSLTVGNEP
jgi:hypothetical protein